MATEIVDRPQATLTLEQEHQQLRAAAETAFVKIDAAMHVLRGSQEALGATDEARALALATWAIDDARKLLEDVWEGRA